METQIQININERVSVALKKLDKTAQKILFVEDDNKKFMGTVTDGDIRRFIISNGSLEDRVEVLGNKNSIFFYEGEFSKSEMKSLMISKGIEVIPILNTDHEVVRYVTWMDLFSDTRERRRYSGEVDVPVVIMAGGKGTRLEPFTKILPKPLFPIDDKPIIQHIIDEFKFFGVNLFLLTLNYKGELIQAFMKDGSEDYKIDYVWETDFFGTAGSLVLLKDRVKGEFILSNCDILVRADYADVLKFHRENRAHLTILSAIQHYKIPYGVIEYEEGAHVSQIVEKPEKTYFVNTGVYVLSDVVIDLIPENQKYDMNVLIDNMLENNYRVLTYPVNENDYIDIGQWEEYKQALDKIKAYV